MKALLLNILMGFVLLCAGVALNACTEEIPDQILVAERIPEKAEANMNDEQKETIDTPADTEQQGETAEQQGETAEQQGEITEQPAESVEKPADPDQKEGVGDIPDAPTDSEKPTIPEESSVPEEQTVPEEPTVSEEPSVPGEPTITEVPTGTLEVPAETEPEENVGETLITYKLTVEATKGGDADSRALGFEGTALISTWSIGDPVTVYLDGNSVGTLNAQEAGISTTFVGEIMTGSNMVGKELTLEYLSAKFVGQDGTLDYIAANCDHSIATVTITSEVGQKLTTGEATFVNQQAIAKFTMMNGSEALEATAVSISDGTNNYNITLSPAKSEFYVALRGFQGTFTLTATSGGNTYKFEHSATFVDGKYYAAELPMTPVSFGRKSYGGQTSL